MTTIKVKRLDGRVEMPEFAHADDACFDLRVYADTARSCPRVYSPARGDFLDAPWLVRPNGEGVEIYPWQSVVFHTHLAFEIPEGFFMKIHVRSSTGIRKRLILSNATSVIDAGYRGEVRVALSNIGSEVVVVRDGDRVCQCEIVRKPEFALLEAAELSSTARGTGGIGSTGEA